MNFENIIYQKDAGIATITVNREKALNALNKGVIADLHKAFDDIYADDKIRAVIITGAGRAFVAGADIAEMKVMTAEEGRQMIATGQRLMNRIEYCEKPVIAAINGFALGGGCELAMACDIRIASEKARFGQPETKLGIIPGYGGTQRLPRLVGKGMAKKLIYTGDLIDAKEAYRIGLADGLVAAEELLAEAEKLAKTICSNAPIAMAMAKSAINEGIHQEVRDGVALEAERFDTAFDSADRVEGMSAFLENRKASFKG